MRRLSCGRSMWYTNDDIMLMAIHLSTNGRSRKMVAHDFLSAVSARVLLAQHSRGQPAPHHCRHRMGESRLGQLTQAMARAGLTFSFDHENLRLPTSCAKIRTVPDNLSDVRRHITVS